MLVIAGHVRIDPAKSAEARSAANEVMAATRDEAGCISYTFSADLQDEAVFHIFEEWESEEALGAHFQTPHMATFQGKFGALGVSETRLQKYEVASVAPLGG